MTVSLVNLKGEVVGGYTVQG